MPAPAPPAPGLGEYLRERRIELGLTTTEVALSVGVHQTTVSGWELGRGLKRLPERASKVATALDLEVEEVQRLWWEQMGGYLADLASVA